MLETRSKLIIAAIVALLVGAWVAESLPSWRNSVTDWQPTIMGRKAIVATDSMQTKKIRVDSIYVEEGTSGIGVQRSSSPPAPCTDDARPRQYEDTDDDLIYRCKNGQWIPMADDGDRDGFNNFIDQNDAVADRGDPDVVASNIVGNTTFWDGTSAEITGTAPYLRQRTFSLRIRARTCSMRKYCYFEHGASYFSHTSTTSHQFISYATCDISQNDRRSENFAGAQDVTDTITCYGYF